MQLKVQPGMRLATFPSRKKFREWLEKNHATARELILRCYKNHAKEKGLTYQEALEEALCFGWIDGVRRAVDADSFSQRFSPRLARSNWSAVNVRRVNELRVAGLMHPAGEAAFAAHTTSGTKPYSYESRATELDIELLKQLKANKRAWAFFQSQPPWYQRTSSFWVMAAKRDETRQRRLAELISRSAKGEPIKLLDRRPK
jgi:uncharacterized protein YdeI (YjbR/CyaY-like superfamily)